MNSRIAEKIGFPHAPVALCFADEAPEGALAFAPGKWGCVMWLFGSATGGKTAAVSRETFGCWGAGVGFGFGNRYVDFPGGTSCFCRFLSSGNAGVPEGEAVTNAVRPHVTPELYDELMHGERYLKGPEHVARFLELLPMTEIPAKHVVMKPLSEVDPSVDRVKAVAFLADPDRISALVVLANYEGPDNERVFVPFAAGCQSIGIYPFREEEKEHPRAVLGHVDLSSRVNLKGRFGTNLFTLAVPWKLFLQMEGNAEGSFLDRHTWKKLTGAE